MTRLFFNKTPKIREKKNRTVTLMVMLFFCITSFAREYEGHTPFADEELTGQVWNFAGRSGLDGRKAQLELVGNVYWERMPERTDFFVFHGDSLCWRGYHLGRRLGLLADSVVYLYDFGVLDGSAVTSSYHAEGHLDVTMKVEEFGRMEWSNFGKGKVLLASGDTLTNVILTRHLTRCCFEGSDSTDLSEAPAVECYRWYVHGSKLPIAIQSGDCLFVAENNMELRNIEDTEDELDRLRRLMDASTVEFSPDGVTVTVAEEMELYIYIMDVSGNTYGSATSRGTEFYLSTSGLPSGQYILSIIPESNFELAKKILFNK